jgi:hypothetical protein
MTKHNIYKSQVEVLQSFLDVIDEIINKDEINDDMILENLNLMNRTIKCFVGVNNLGVIGKPIVFREKEDKTKLIEFLNLEDRPKILDFQSQISCKSHPEIGSGNLTKAEIDIWNSHQDEIVKFYVFL